VEAVIGAAILEARGESRSGSHRRRPGSPAYNRSRAPRRSDRGGTPDFEAVADRDS